ncbi:MAG: oxidoreductase [Candidatus Marinimicrobia bacterium]|nr:oxidoreductase [Candidatus Neomarinimicrobiota bacterium]
MAFDPVDLKGKKLLITGVTGQVARPLVNAYAKNADVYAMARYGKEEDREAMEVAGATPLKADLNDPASLSAVPDDLDYVINAAVAKSGDFAEDLKGNAEGVGHLMARCKNVKAFLHISTTGIYAQGNQEPRPESSPMGDNHKNLLPTYSICKIAAESTCRFAASIYGVPTTIARLNVPYGDNGGWPAMHLEAMRKGEPIIIHPTSPNFYNPIHVDDYIEKIPRLLACASKDITLTNFGGSQKVSIEEWCNYIGELTGLEPKLMPNAMAFGSITIDLTIMHGLIGETKVDWRDGMKRMVKALAPEALAV